MAFTHKTGLALALLALGIVAPSAHAQTYDAANDFSATNDPNGVWSYGYENTLGGALILYTSQDDPTANTKGWIYNLGLGDPVVLKNFGNTQDSFGGDVVLQPGQLIFHPGPNDQYSIIRFTAPQAGSYSLTSGFTSATTHGVTTDVHVLENGTSLFDGLVTGTPSAPTSAPTFSTNLLLNQGDTVDFAVGYGTNGNYFYDSTGVTATFAPLAAAPEPSSLSMVALTALGLGGLMVRARRKKRTEE